MSHPEAAENNSEHFGGYFWRAYEVWGEFRQSTMSHPEAAENNSEHFWGIFGERTKFGGVLSKHYESS